MKDEKYLNAVQMLYDNGIMCEVVRDVDNTFKLAVEGEFHFFDYFPSTGRWKERLTDDYCNTAKSGFSLRKLIKYIREKSVYA